MPDMLCKISTVWLRGARYSSPTTRERFGCMVNKGPAARDERFDAKNKVSRRHDVGIMRALSSKR